jgi:hypothetical protein
MNMRKRGRGRDFGSISRWGLTYYDYRFAFQSSVFGNEARKLNSKSEEGRERKKQCGFLNLQIDIIHIFFFSLFTLLARIYPSSSILLGWINEGSLKGEAILQQVNCNYTTEIGI